MRQLVTRLSVLLVFVALSGSSSAQQPSSTEASAQPAAAGKARSPWLLLPVFSSSPKLGTSGGGMGAYMRTFDAKSRVSLFGTSYQYTSTHSQIASAFARTSFGADHHRIIALGVFGNIKNDYDDYLGTGLPLKTDDDLRAIVARYLFRVKGDWFIGPQGTAANYQVLGATDEDDLVLITLGVRGFKSAALGAVLMHDSRDNEDMPVERLVPEYKQSGLSRSAGRGGVLRCVSRGTACVLATRRPSRAGRAAIQLVHRRCAGRRRGDGDPSRL